MDIQIKQCTWLIINKTRKTAILNPTTDQGVEELNRTGKLDLKILPMTSVNGFLASKAKSIAILPRNLNFYFPNLFALDFGFCALECVTRADFENSQTLKEIHLNNNLIKELPADVFIDLINLEVLSLDYNKIIFIAEDTFKHLEKLTFVNLASNPSFDIIFADNSREDLKIDEDTIRVYNLRQLNLLIEKFFHATPKIYDDINKTLKIDDFRDFTIKIDENEFKVHKLMLAARSPTLAEIIKNNPDAEKLILTDIDVEVFEIILGYIYDDEMPENYQQLSEKVYRAAGKLKMDQLLLDAGRILSNDVNTENSFEMLKLATKYNHEELKKKSFAELKKFLGDESLNDELMNNLELLTKVVDAKRDYEEKVKQMMEEFEKMISKN